jgi:hypothetical protein
MLLAHNDDSFSAPDCETNRRQKRRQSAHGDLGSGFC